MLARSVALLCVIALLAACSSPEDRVASYLDKARQLFDEGQYVEARIEARNAVQIRPKNAQARLLLAELALEQKAYVAALNHLKIAVETEPELLDARLSLGFLYYYGRALEELSEQVEIANRLAPQDPRVLLMNARLLEARGDKTAALDKLDKSLRADPSSAQAIGFMASLAAELQGEDAGIAVINGYLGAVAADEVETLRALKAVFLSNAGRDDEVEAEIRQLAADYPDNERYPEALTRYYVAEGRVEDAEQVLRDVIRRDQADVGRQIDLIQFLAGQRDSESAEAALKDFIRNSPDSPELRLTLGQLYDSEGRLDDAIVEYERTIAMAPGSNESFVAQNRIVSVLARRGKSDAARALVERILAERPDDEGALLARAAFNMASGHYQDVIADARVIVRKNPASEDGRIMMARVHQALGETLLAQDAYRSVLDDNPTSAPAATGLATLLVEGGKPGEALAVLEPVTQSEQTDVAALEVLAVALTALGDLEAAENAARRIVESDSGSGSGDYQFGRIAETRGDINEAISFYKRALQKDPALLAALQALVSVSLSGGRSNEAIEASQQFIADNPDQSGARLLLASAYLQAGRASAAEQEFKQLIADEPALPQAYVNLAAVYDDDSDQRYETLRRGLRANPEDLRLGILLGLEYERHGRVDDAIAAYEEAMALNPDNALVPNNLAMLLLDHRSDESNLGRAMELSRRFERSDEATELDTLGWAYYRNGDYPAAVRVLERVVASVGEVAVLRYHLGMAYRAAGNLVQAEAELARAVALADQPFTGIEEAKVALAELRIE